MSSCCITDQDQKEAIEGLQVVYQAASNAALTAPQHEAVRNAAQKVVATLEKINGTTVDAPLEPVEVVKD
jgi:hypothetical protein